MDSMRPNEKQLTSGKPSTSYPDPNGLPAYSDLSATTTHVGNDDEQLLARLGYKQVNYER
jgi:hypothetical protein